jgi:hypothetical protein
VLCVGVASTNYEEKIAMSDELQDKFRMLATRYGVSIGAVEALAHALRASHGRQAQFNHPELGGMGQWQSGMVMVGDMFNTALKARVDGLATELSTLLTALTAASPTTDFKPLSGFATAWWPSDLGTPDSAGGQNDLAYAYFASINRLLIRQHGRTTVYDTTGHRVSGVAQQQANGTQIVVFSTANGVTEITKLPIIP